MDLRAYVIGQTGWTWAEAGTLTIPRLRALIRYWRQNPSADWLLRQFMDYKPPPEQVQTPGPAPEESDDRPPAWVAGMPSIPASEALRQAQSTEERVAVWERQFFGELKDVV